MTIVRYLVGYVFMTSGIMKFVNPELGETFISLNLPFPLQFMTAIAVIEIICGLLIILKKWVQQATFPLIGIMIGAIILTKFPVLNDSFMQFAFNARLDIVMLVLLAYLYFE
ncbi:DoxX family protein [Siminovitchia sp. FSL H7-0308]|uniref:DoxX family protein n=1 Tax=unclassified Siminovitchia TaxID=2837530 RepID=UPI0030CC1835